MLIIIVFLRATLCAFVDEHFLDLYRYVTCWQDWAWSSATEYLEKLGPERAAQLWREFPILNYGEGWDKD